jgi:hypothetical protein
MVVNQPKGYLEGNGSETYLGSGFELVRTVSMPVLA